MKFIALAALCFAMSACATAPSIIEARPKAVHWQVTHISQLDDYSCATTAWAMAINYFQKPGAIALGQATAWKLSGTAPDTVRTKGNDMAGLAKIANHFGLHTEYINQIGLPQLEYLLSTGALVILNIHTSPSPNSNHAVLATGYDQAKRCVFVEDPADQRSQLSYDDLPNYWSAVLSQPRGGSTQSGFVVYPKSWSAQNCNGRSATNWSMNFKKAMQVQSRSGAMPQLILLCHPIGRTYT